jgi:hypothetical protein
MVTPDLNYRVFAFDASDVGDDQPIEPDERLPPGAEGRQLSIVSPEFPEFRVPGISRLARRGSIVSPGSSKYRVPGIFGISV